MITAAEVKLDLLAELAYLSDFEVRVFALDMGMDPEMLTNDITRADLINECLRLELYAFSH